MRNPQDVEFVVHGNPAVDVVDDGVVHLPNRLPRAVGELQHVLMPEMGIASKPDHISLPPFCIMYD